MVAMDSDEALLLAWRDGDTTAGQALVQRYFGVLYRFFSNKVHDGLEDLVQDTLIECVRDADRFRGASSFRTFVFAIARHCLARHYRGRDRAARMIPMNMDSIAESPISPSAHIFAQQRRRALLRALRELPIDLQIALELFHWEDLSAREIAEVLAIPEGTVRTRLRRARELLAAQLAQLASGSAGSEPVLVEHIDTVWRDTSGRT